MLQNLPSAEQIIIFLKEDKILHQTIEENGKYSDQTVTESKWVLLTTIIIIILDVYD